jgi:hypothetical protein
MFRYAMVVFCAFFLMSPSFAGDSDSDGANEEGGRKRSKTDGPFLIARPDSPITVGALLPLGLPPRGHGAGYFGQLHIPKAWPGALRLGSPSSTTAAAASAPPSPEPDEVEDEVEPESVSSTRPKKPKPRPKPRPKPLKLDDTTTAPEAPGIGRAGAFDWTQLQKALPRLGPPTGGIPDRK